MALDVVVDRARCMASKACMNAAEGVFRIVDGAAAVVDVAAASDADLLAAAEACPVSAITVYRDGGQIS